MNRLGSFLLAGSVVVVALLGYGLATTGATDISFGEVAPTGALQRLHESGETATADERGEAPFVDHGGRFHELHRGPFDRVFDQGLTPPLGQSG